MKQALAALRVVPLHAQLQVVALLALALLVLWLPWVWLPEHHRLLAGIELVLVFALLGFLWCRIPVGLWLIPRDLHGFVDPNGKGPLHLSFDDGPTAGQTEALLDLLAQHQVRASFFVLLHKAERWPQIIARIVREGHVLGLHGEDHRLPLWQSQQSLTDSLARGKHRLESIAGQPVTLYRPSHGVRTPALLSALRQCQLRLCMWDHGIWDTDAPPEQTLLGRIHQVHALGKKGDRPRVLLLHDGKGDPPSIPAHAPTLHAALTQYLTNLRATAGE